MLELYILVGLMIVGAVIAVESRSLLGSVISVGAVGFLLCVVFLYLQAPDVALTQLVVEIVVLVILIRATISRDITAEPDQKEFIRLAFLAGFVGAILFFVYLGLQFLPPFGDPLLTVAQVYIDTGLEKTGAANLVTSILLNFRASDTLGGATVLFAAIVGAMLLLRKEGRKEKDARNE